MQSRNVATSSTNARQIGWSTLSLLAVALSAVACTASVAPGMQRIKQGNLRRRAQAVATPVPSAAASALRIDATIATVATPVPSAAASAFDAPLGTVATPMPSAAGSAFDATGTPEPTMAGTSRLGYPLIDIAISDVMEPAHRQATLGAQFQTVTKFNPVKVLEYNNVVKPYLDQNLQVVMVIEFFDEYETNLQNIVDGEYDDYIYKFIDEHLADGNRFIWIRPLHEMNGNWYSWGTIGKPEGTNTPELFIQAFQHIHDMFTIKEANVKFQLAYNCENGNDDKTPFITWFPGEQYVDMVVCSGYNRAGTPNHDKWDSFAEVFRGGYEQMAALPGNLPLGAGETGTVGFEDNDKAQWFRDAFLALVTEFPRVTQVTWLLQNKEGDGDWDLNSAAEIYAFGQCLRGYTRQDLELNLFPYLPLADVAPVNADGTVGDGIINGDDALKTVDANGNGQVDPDETLPIAGTVPPVADTVPPTDPPAV